MGECHLQVPSSSFPEQGGGMGSPSRSALRSPSREPGEAPGATSLGGDLASLFLVPLRQERGAVQNMKAGVQPLSPFGRLMGLNYWEKSISFSLLSNLLKQNSYTLELIALGRLFS